jgi:hypothetical protein
MSQRAPLSPPATDLELHEAINFAAAMLLAQASDDEDVMLDVVVTFWRRAAEHGRSVFIADHLRLQEGLASSKRSG